MLAGLLARDAQQPQRLLVHRFELDRRLQRRQRVAEQRAAGAHRARFGQRGQQVDVVRCQVRGAPERGGRLVEAFEVQVGAAEQRPALQVVGTLRELGLELRQELLERGGALRIGRAGAGIGTGLGAAGGVGRGRGAATALRLLHAGAARVGAERERLRLTDPQVEQTGGDRHADTDERDQDERRAASSSPRRGRVQGGRERALEPVALRGEAGLVDVAGIARALQGRELLARDRDVRVALAVDGVGVRARRVVGRRRAQHAPAERAQGRRDEQRGEHEEDAHAGRTSSSSISVPCASDGCRKITGLPCAPIRGSPSPSTRAPRPTSSSRASATSSTSMHT